MALILGILIGVLAVALVFARLVIRIQRRIIAAHEVTIEAQKGSILAQERMNTSLTNMLLGVPQMYPNEVSMNN